MRMSSRAGTFAGPVATFRKTEEVLSMHRLRVVPLAFLAVILALASTLLNVGGTTRHAVANHNWVIALSNSYYGNIWRHQMEQAWVKAANTAKAQGQIASYVIENGDGTANQQQSQMNDLILKHVNAVSLDAASPTALNGSISKAHAAGIKVISFDSIARSPYAYKLDFDFVKLETTAGTYIAKLLHGHGNVVLVRGIAGSDPDIVMYSGMQKVLKRYPGLKVVSTVYGQATTSVAESKLSAILPSLPKIDAVLDEGGGDDYGIVQAFQAAHRPFPVIMGSGSAEFIHWWIQQYKKSHYQTISVNSAPGAAGSAGFWVTLDALNGMKVPTFADLPLGVVTTQNLMQYKNMQPNTIVSPYYSNAWVMKNIIKGS
jgi:ribose transport system substrate-binding protein